MALFKCKMCGGDLEVAPGASVAECEYCGTKQTLPKVNDEVIQNLFNRANNLRIKCEFDKAEQIYEKILQENDAQSEAHWGIVLCKYGIEYVEDPKTFKRIPTCHRTSYDAVTADADYLAAIEHADTAQRGIYEAEAKAIDAIQKDILHIVKNEKPFDVFICYKETDENGKRTVDSVIANDIYYQLTQEGLKVFYAAITLEDKLGREYEPYIFAALNSAKVMLVIGTKPQYFSAVWVKNEWSRFLKLMKTDRSKLLIPCYKDMDAYDLPEEFSHLQAQDMGKIGFINDVVRGIKKITQADTPKTTVVKETVISGGNTNIASLLERAFIFLEDADWDSADECFEKVLDIDPKNSQAYLGKLMAELQVRKQEVLKNSMPPLANKNYQRMVRFADQKLRDTLGEYIVDTSNLLVSIETAKTTILECLVDGCSYTAKDICGLCSEIFGSDDQIHEEDSRAVKTTEKLLAFLVHEGLLVRNYNKYDWALYSTAITEQAYVAACEAMAVASTEEDYLEVVRCFKSIFGYKDADARTQECLDLAEKARLSALYTSALSAMNAAKTAQQYIAAAAQFESIKTFKDAQGQYQACMERAELSRKDAIYSEGKTKMTGVSISNYESAIKMFKLIPGWRDADEQIIACQRKIEEIKAKQEAERLEKERLAEIARKKAEKRAKRTKKIAIITTLIVCAVIAFIIVLNTVIIPNYRLHQLKNTKVGSYISFGAYEQDNNTSNGKEDVEWLVLEVKEGKALVISKYALDCQRYNTSYTDVTWETCTLRKWLNNDFINAAFSADEKAMIPTVTVSADKNPDYSTNPGIATQDQVFLLSVTEADKYFSSDSARQCKPTEYAVANGVYVSSANGNCWWWLRSPGYTQDFAARVLPDGGVGELGDRVDYVDRAVRPALWIDLSKI